MKNLCLTLSLLLLTGAASAQKVAVKNGLMTVDRQPYAYLELDGGNTVYVSSLQHERLFVVKEMWLPDPYSPRSTHYLQYVFTASRTVVETSFPSSDIYFRLIGAARQIYAARLLSNGTLDPKAVADFRTNNGTLYLDYQRQFLPPPAPASN